jgi:hypothetical protein
MVQVHREAEGSLLATQLLLAQGALAQPATASGKVVPASARKVLLEIRTEIRNVTGMYWDRGKRKPTPDSGGIALRPRVLFSRSRLRWLAAAPGLGRETVTAT